ncbi:MAG TPA: type I secretion system permease/ATPase [Sedimenticola thiotaurini]|uniref:Type I secretion system permease/ATPase n=1 Tax=Sedimenticola thiotaurini TaxID=1543721 RepID=A0A831W816_9GAMM|nr:type I secretion system permease/ATPase [Sedimenticola thiotaurini]
MNEQYTLPRLIGRFRGAFLSIGVFSFFFNLLVLTLPFYMLSVFTRVLSSKSEETLVLLTIAAAIALTVQGLLDMIRARLLTRIGMGLDSTLTPQVLEATVRQAAGSAGRNAQALRDASELRTFLSGTGIFSLFDAPFIPLYVGVIYLMHPMLGSLAIGGAVLLFIIAVINELATRRPIEAAGEFSAKAQSQVEQYVRHADVIEAMGMTPAVIDRWRSSNSDALLSLSKASDKINTAGSFARYLRFMLQIALYGTGAFLFIEHELLPGAMIAAAILMSRALAPVEHAIGTWKSLVSAKAAYGRLKEALDPERFSLYYNRMELPRPNGLLQADRIVVTVPGGERFILKGINFVLPPGQFLGVIGPSGAGKTTLGKVLVGILAPRGGAARLDGTDLAAWHPDDLGRYVGYLPQDIQLFSGTVRDNIARMTEESDPEAVIRAAKRAGAHDMILTLPEAYDTEVGESGRYLSAGQRQMIGLARAFYGDPSLLVLDEPNSNLDAVSEEHLKRSLAEARDAGVTVVVITHRPSILVAADQLLVLKDGGVELYGPSDQVQARMAQDLVSHDERKRMSQDKRRLPRDASGKRDGRRGGAARAKASGIQAAAGKGAVADGEGKRRRGRPQPARPAAGEAVAAQEETRAGKPEVAVEASPPQRGSGAPNAPQRPAPESREPKTVEHGEEVEVKEGEILEPEPESSIARMAGAFMGRKGK